MKSINAASLNYLALIDNEAPVNEGIQRGRRLEVNFQNLLTSNQNLFKVNKLETLVSSEIKKAYWQNGTTAYLRSILEKVSLLPNHFGGRTIPDFWVVDAELVLPKPNNLLESFETSANEKGRLLYTLLISLLVHIEENQSKGLETPQVMLFIFARSSTINKGYLKLLKEKPIKFFTEHLYFHNAAEDEEWKHTFNDIIDNYSPKRIREQMDFHISEIPDNFTNFDLTGIAEKLEKAYEEKKKRLYEHKTIEATPIIDESPCNVQCNITNSEMVINGEAQGYGKSIWQVRDPKIFYFSGGKISSSNRIEIATNFLKTFKEVFTRFSSTDTLKGEITLDFSTTHLCEGAGHSILLLVDELIKQYNKAYISKYDIPISQVLKLYIPQVLSLEGAEKKNFSLLEKYFPTLKQNQGTSLAS